jgi:hypothetical protein
VVREPHGLALLVKGDQVAAPGHKPLDALDKAIVREAFLARFDGERFAKFGQRQRPLHGVDPAEDFPRDIRFAILRHAAQD